MRTCLNIIYRMLSNDDNIIDNLMSNNQIDLLEKFLSYIIYSIPTPIANSEIIFNIPLTSEKIKILSPYKDKIRDLQIINFPYILSKFSVENIIKIYKLMLFEQKILFIDTIYYNISTVINSFTNILYPIDWINTIIPIMSSPMVCYLQTFLPLLMVFLKIYLKRMLNIHWMKLKKEFLKYLFIIILLNIVSQIMKKMF